jgi:hypothetical protein
MIGTNAHNAPLGFHSSAFAVQSGTSLSSPHVAAVALMIADKWPELSPNGIRKQLKLSCQPLHTDMPDHIEPFGLNAAKAVNVKLF